MSQISTLGPARQLVVMIGAALLLAGGIFALSVHRNREAVVGLIQPRRKAAGCTAAIK